MGGGSPVGPKAWREWNANELTDLGNYEDVSGFPVYKALLCEVERVAGADDDAAEIPKSSSRRSDTFEVASQEKPERA